MSKERTIPTYTHRELVEIAYRWVMVRGSCGFAFKELVTAAPEIPDVIGFGSGSHSVMIECKTSRSDFFADRNKPFRFPGCEALGKFRYYCVPSGLIKAEELPEGWGLINVDERRRSRAVVNPLGKSWGPEREAAEHKVSHWGERAMMYSALRRLQIRGHMEEIYDGAPEELLTV